MLASSGMSVMPVFSLERESSLYSCIAVSDKWLAQLAHSTPSNRSLSTPAGMQLALKRRVLAAAMERRSCLLKLYVGSVSRLAREERGLQRTGVERVIGEQVLPAGLSGACGNTSGENVAGWARLGGEQGHHAPAARAVLDRKGPSRVTRGFNALLRSLRPASLHLKPPHTVLLTLFLVPHMPPTGIQPQSHEGQVCGGRQSPLRGALGIPNAISMKQNQQMNYSI